MGARLGDIKKKYHEMIDGTDLGNAFEKGITKVSSWGSATRQEIDKVRNATKAYREETLAAINASIDMSSASGKQNYNALQDWNTTGKNGGDVAAVYEKADDQLKQYLDTCKTGEATWDGFVKYQQKSATSLKATSLSARAAAAGMKVLNAAMSMAVMVALQFAIQKLVEGLDYLIHMQDKLNEKAEEARKQYEETTEELNAQEEALKNLQNLSFNKLIITQLFVVSIYKNKVILPLSAHKKIKNVKQLEAYQIAFR